MLLLTSSAAAAQEPIGPFAVDVRAAIPRFSEDLAVAEALDVASTNLPTSGLGLSGGAHFYPLRLGAVTLGLGGELLVSRGSRTQAPVEEGGLEGPTVNTRFSAISPQLSLNFGARDGWSYLSGGIGWASFTTEREDQPVADAGTRTRAINYGGGARWFMKRHLAFAFDLRFYAVSGQPAAVGRPAYPRARRMVFSAGVSIR